jgi:hypothetical protein
VTNPPDCRLPAGPRQDQSSVPHSSPPRSAGRGLDSLCLHTQRRPSPVLNSMVVSAPPRLTVLALLTA